MGRIGVGEDTPPEHLLIEAARPYSDGALAG
jgi:hypothetical protein